MSEPYDIYLFEDCNDSSNLFRFENISGSLTEGYVYSISGGSGFTGYAKVITYSEVGDIYSTDGVVFVGGATQCPTPTPTQTPESTPTATPTSTPIEEIFEMPMLFSAPPSGCATTDFCFRTTLPSLSGFSGNYTLGTNYGGVPTYSGDGTTVGVIYYFSGGTSYWCLSDTLGGTCYLRGASPCTSDCPDIAANDFNTGICPTPTPTPINCSIFNFNAYFDCDWEPLPTPSPSVDCDDVNFIFDVIGVTPTPTPTSASCNFVAVSFSMSGYTPATTPTVTLTPSVTLTKTVDIQGQVTFEMLGETFSCVSVKVLTDCQSGQEYYVTDNLSFAGIPVVIGMTLLVNLNGGFQCVTYTRDDTNFSSNSNVEEIIQLYASCEYCSVIPTPTPTVTTTPTITPSSTQTPTITPSSTQTPTPSITASPSVTPSQTATVGTTPPITPTQTQTPTNTQTTTPTNTATRTPTPTNTSTPSSTPNYVYVYQSCSPIAPNVLNTQMIQTQVVPFANQLDVIFKDLQGNCWTYIGRFETTYIAPISVFTVTYEGNYFDGSNSLTYPNCQDCQSNTPNPIVWYVLENCNDATTAYSIEYYSGTFSNRQRVTTTDGLFTFIVIGELLFNPGGILQTLVGTPFTECPPTPIGPTYLYASTYELPLSPNETQIFLQVGDGSVLFTTDVTFNYNISTIPSGGFSGIGTLPAGSSQVFITSYDPMLEQISSTQVNNFNPSPVDGYIIDTIN